MSLSFVPAEYLQRSPPSVNPRHTISPSLFSGDSLVRAARSSSPLTSSAITWKVPASKIFFRLSSPVFHKKIPFPQAATATGVPFDSKSRRSETVLVNPSDFVRDADSEIVSVVGSKFRSSSVPSTLPQTATEPSGLTLITCVVFFLAASFLLSNSICASSSLIR